LETVWEQYATLLANAVSDDDLITNIKYIITECSIDMSITASVVFGHDTRPSCPDLIRSLQDGLASLETKQINAGLVTTPQLHYLVRCLNTQGSTEAYGEPTVEGYYRKLAKAFTTLSVNSTPVPSVSTLISTSTLRMDAQYRLLSLSTAPME
jgi:phosphoacetylglucosamine mutase